MPESAVDWFTGRAKTTLPTRPPSAAGSPLRWTTHRCDWSRHFRRPRQGVGRQSRDDNLHGGWQDRRRRGGPRGACPWARAGRSAGFSAPDTEIQWPQARRSGLRLFVTDCGAVERQNAPMVGRCTARQYQLQFTPTGTRSMANSCRCAQLRRRRCAKVLALRSRGMSHATSAAWPQRPGHHQPPYAISQQHIYARNVQHLLQPGWTRL